MRTLRPEPSGEAGFTLIEVLVALAVCGFVVAALAPAFSANAIRARGAEDRLKLVNVERRVLEMLPPRGEMGEGGLNGTLDGVDWRLRAFALPRDIDGNQNSPWTPYRVEIDLTAGNGIARHLELIRLGGAK